MLNLKQFSFSFSILVFTILSGFPVFSAPGDFDLTFNQTGKSLLGFGKGDDKAAATAIQADGKIVVAGTSSYKFAVVRYNPDGSLDTSFDSDGKVITLVGGGYATSIAIQPDGKIIVAGGSIIRYNPNGSLDTTFDSDGIVSLANVGMVNSIALQPDGKIVATANFGFKTVRYNNNGSLDTSFDFDGIAATTIAGFENRGNSVVIQSNGKIIVTGSSLSVEHIRNFTTIRYNSDGSLDTGFGSGGIILTPTGGQYGYSSSAAIQPDGKIIISGQANNSIAIIRYNSEGSLDTGFNSQGIVYVPISEGSGWSGILATQPDGKILVGGRKNGEFSVARCNLNGTIDSTFGTNGIVTTQTSKSGSSGASAIALQSNGKIVLTGSNTNNAYSTNPDFATIRYNSDGSLDRSFNAKGIVVTDVGDENVAAQAVAVQTDGKIVAASFGNSFREVLRLVRYNVDGTLDTSFDSNGIVTSTQFGTIIPSYTSIALQADGKIIVAGAQHNGTNRDFALLRFNLDGSSDSGFGLNGKVITPIAPRNSGIRSITVQSDGKIVAVGYVETGQGIYGVLSSFAVARYNYDGSLDQDFNHTGIVTTVVGKDIGIANSVAIQPDGKIIAGGNGGVHCSTVCANNFFAVVRYNFDGSLDTSFSSDGKVLTPIGVTSLGNSVAVQPDGKIVLAGYSYLTQFQTAFATVQYNSNGSLDTSFDSDGIVTTLIGTNGSGGYSMVIQSDGKLVVAGVGNNSFAVVRYNPDGSLDNSFVKSEDARENGGIVQLNISNFSNGLYAMTLDSYGRIILAGSADGLFCVVRLQSTVLSGFDAKL